MLSAVIPACAAVVWKRALNAVMLSAFCRIRISSFCLSCARCVEIKACLNSVQKSAKVP